MTRHEHDDEVAEAAGAYWDGRYRGDIRWSGKVNQLLADEVQGLEAGHALDVGCGTGGDAIWLAAQGWTVTGVDVSTVAVDQAAVHATEAGVAERTTWIAADVTTDLPSGPFDLVASSYLHAPPGVPLERIEILRSAAERVVPGGSLVVVSHGGPPPWVGPDHPYAQVPLLSADELVAALDLGDGWQVVRAEVVDRPMTDPDGNPCTRPDHVVHLRRRA